LRNADKFWAGALVWGAFVIRPSAKRGSAHLHLAHFNQKLQMEERWLI